MGRILGRAAEQTEDHSRDDQDCLTEVEMWVLNA